MTNAEIIDGLKAVRTIHNGNYAPFIDEAIEKLKDMDCVLDQIKAEFINRYPKNYAGEPELGGTSCVFSLYKVLEIINKYKAESEE